MELYVLDPLHNHQLHSMTTKLKKHLAPPPTTLYTLLHKRSQNQFTQQSSPRMHKIVPTWLLPCTCKTRRCTCLACLRPNIISLINIFMLLSQSHQYQQPRSNSSNPLTAMIDSHNKPYKKNIANTTHLLIPSYFRGWKCHPPSSSSNRRCKQIY